MRRPRRLALPLVLALLSVLTLAISPAAASSAHPSGGRSITPESGTGGTCLSCTTTTYYADAVYKLYDGFYDRNTGRGCIGPCTITVTESESWSNTWGASIEFKADVVTYKVGYDVTYGSSRSFSYSFFVPAGKTGVVHYQDWYHVTDFYAHKVTCGKSCTTTYGTAWGAKWYQRIFYLST